MKNESCCDTHSGGHGGHGGMRDGHHGHNCCCHSERRFITHAEQLEHLEMYREQVELELKGVKEHIDHLKGVQAHVDQFKAKG